MVAVGRVGAMTGKGCGFDSVPRFSYFVHHSYGTCCHGLGLTLAVKFSQPADLASMERGLDER